MKSAGIALISTILLLGAIAVLTAALVFSAHLELRAARNEAGHEAALYAADAGVGWLMAEAGRAPDFAALLARAAGGGAPFTGFQWFGRSGSAAFRLAVEPGASSDGLLVVSEGRSPDGGRARVEAHLRRAAAFVPPSVATLGSGLLGVAFDGTVGIASTNALTPLGAETAEAASLWESARAAGPEVLYVGDTGLARSAISLAQAPDDTLEGPVASGSYGSTESPHVVSLAGNGEISGDVDVHGILVSEVPIRVSGTLRVEGMLLAIGGLEITGVVEVTGGLHVEGLFSGPVGARLDLATSAEALSAAERSRPSSLPRRCILGAWRELW